MQGHGGGRAWWLTAALISLLPACKQEDGTFVLVRFQGDFAGKPVQRIDMALAIGTAGTQGARSDTVSFSVGSDKTIKLPTTATLIIRSGEGALTLNATALDSMGGTVASGTGSGVVKRNTTTSAVVTFGGDPWDADAGAGSDAQTADDALTTGGNGGAEDSGSGNDGGGAGGGDGTGGSSGGAGGAGGSAGGAGGAGGGAGGITGGGGGSSTGGNSGSDAGGVIRLLTSPQGIDFGMVSIGKTSSSQTMTIKNLGTSTAGLLKISIDDGVHFLLKQDGCGNASLGPGQNCTMTYAFAPGVAGPALTKGTITEASGITVTFTLSGTGVAGAVDLLLAPQSADFKTINVGIASEIPFTVTNNGSTSVSNPRIVITDSPAFRVSNNQCATTVLLPKGQCAFAIAFAPVAYGPVSATVSVADATGKTLSGSATVTGTGRKTMQLKVFFAGNAGGSVMWADANIHSSSPCTQGYDVTDAASVRSLTLVATPDPGKQFSGWSGDCTGTGPCNLTMNADHAVTATFVNANAGTVSINILGYNGQQGTVASMDASINCTMPVCPGLPYSGANDLTLVARPASGSTFIGWSDGPCKGTTPTCSFPVNGAVTVTAIFGVQSYMFVSSGVYVPGQLGSVDNADSICQKLAESAKLPGTYKAWLSTKGTNAKDRVGQGGWVRTDGRPVARNLSTLISQDHGVLYPPRLDESGRDLGGVHIQVATGGRADGTAESSQCTDYTSTIGPLLVGDAAAGGGAWAMKQAELGGCGRYYHLYCFRSDATATDFVPIPLSGRQVFVSRPFAVGGGTLAADSQCQLEAAAANLPNAKRFVAFIATTSASAISRVSDGLPWKRTDGVFVTRSFKDLASDLLLAPMGVAADGTSLTNPSVWTGAVDASKLGNSTCGDWTSGSAGGPSIGMATVGNANTTVTPDWFAAPGTATACADTNTRLACIEP